MELKIRNAGIQVIDGDDYVECHVFSFNDDEDRAIYFDCTREQAIANFKSSGDVQDDGVTEVSLQSFQLEKGMPVLKIYGSFAREMKEMLGKIQQEISGL